MNIDATNEEISTLKKYGYCCVTNIGHSGLDPEVGDTLTISEENGDEITAKIIALQNEENSFYEVVLTIRF